MAKTVSEAVSLVDELTRLHASLILADKHLCPFNFDDARVAKQRLRTDSPAISFGCGNRALFNRGFLRACSSVKYRKYLMSNNLVLISTFHPEAAFNAGNAMQRNKYIYCLSDAAMAVQSGTKGGTWSGAMENLKKQWVPLWVKRTSDKLAGNSAIVKAGAAWAPDNIREIDFTSLFPAKTPDAGLSEDLFSMAAGDVKEGVVDYSPVPQLESKPNLKIDDEVGTRREAIIDQISQPEGNSEECVTPQPFVENVEFYDLFLIRVQAMCSNSAKTTDELVDVLELNKTQLNIWLKKAVADKKLKKLSRPVRYQWKIEQQGALPL